MAEVTIGQSVKVEVNRSGLPGKLDLVDAIRKVAGCKGNDMIVNAPRHESSKGTECYSLSGRFQVGEYTFLVNCNVSVAGTKVSK